MYVVQGNAPPATVCLTVEQRVAALYIVAAAARNILLDEDSVVAAILTQVYTYTLCILISI